MRRVSAQEAVAAIPPGARVLLPHGCVEPTSIYRALRESPGDPARPPTLLSGLQFGDYEFLGDPAAGAPAELGGLGRGYRYVTWQVGPKLRRWMPTGRIGFLPLRYRDIPRILGPGGPLQVDVVVLQCAPPVRGRINLGICCTFLPAAIAAARCVIAEIHPDMPRTAGETEIAADRIDLAVDAVAPLAELPRARIDAVDRAIARRVLALIEEGSAIQLGVGAVPEAVLEALSGAPGIHLYSGMLTDGLGDFLDRARADQTILTGEVCGTQALYQRVGGEARVRFETTARTHDIPHLSRVPRLIAINSAVEVDLWGQVNGETIDGEQISGVGGSLDFIEGARYSERGRSVIALRSTARGRSRIVPRLGAGSAVTVPRFAVDTVVTEHGVARLIGLTVEERAAALIEVAAPEHRSALRDAAARRGRE